MHAPMASASYGRSSPPPASLPHAYTGAHTDTYPLVHLRLPCHKVIHSALGKKEGGAAEGMQRGNL